jgi:hypothetical protein
MAGRAESGGGGGGRTSRWRIAIWGVAAFLLLLPAVAMQFTDEVNWDETDFAVFGTMLAIAAGTYELAARMTRNSAYRAATGVALAAAFILIWMNLAVGIIGSEDNPANLMYGGVLAVGIIGAVIARARADGMARTLLAAALAQAVIAVIAIAAGLGRPASGPLELLALNGFFIAPWLLSAWLFRKAARKPD